MAFWNAPLRDPDHARNAVKAAREMIAGLEDVNKKLRQQAKEEGRRFIPIKVGVGVNTGPCVVGNMGSQQRFDYSVLGDAVNLASRLEGQCKYYGFDIILGPETAASQKPEDVLELDLIAVKGKSEAVRVYGYLRPEERRTDMTEWHKAHHEMLAAYRSRNWPLAEEKIRLCLSAAPHRQHFYDLYLERISGYRKLDPGEGWDGVYTSLTK